MKKQNNRFRNGNNNCYTLNYKFDSVSIAGKISGTALDLIRRYNDLAKEAQGCGNYVEMEVYRQYAEHYRKIVTEINERRQARFENNVRTEENSSAPTESNDVEAAAEDVTAPAPVEPEPEANGYVETLPASEPVVKSFHVVEINEIKEAPAEEPKPKRVYRRRTPVAQKNSEA